MVEDAHMTDAPYSGSGNYAEESDNSIRLSETGQIHSELEGSSDEGAEEGRHNASSTSESGIEIHSHDIDESEDDGVLDDELDSEEDEDDIPDDEDEDDDDDDEDDDIEEEDIDDLMDDHGDIIHTLEILRRRFGQDPPFAEQLRSENSSVVMDGLARLSAQLLNGGPFIVVSRPVASALVSLLHNRMGDPEILLAAARTVSQVADSGVPNSVYLLVQAGIVDALTGLFDDLAYIDVAEQAVSIMQRVAADSPAAVLEANALNGCLNCLEFFNWHIQRSVLSAVGSICPAVTSQNVEKARGLTPLLLQYVNSGNPALADLALGALCSLIGALSRKSTDPKSDLQECLKVWPALTDRVQPHNALLAKVLRALANLAPYKPAEPTTGKEFAALGQLVSVAITGDASDPDQVFSALLHCPKETLAAALRLLQILLPHTGSPFKFIGPYRRNPTTKLLMSNDDLSIFAPPAARTAMRIYSTSADMQMRQMSLLLLLKLVYHAATFIPADEVVPFLATVVAQSDAEIPVVGALDVAWELATRIPSILPALSAEIGPELIVEDPSPPEPQHAVAIDGDLRAVKAFLSAALASKLASAPMRDAGELHTFIEKLRGDSAKEALLSIPSVINQYSPPELEQAHLFEAVAELPPRHLAQLGVDGLKAIVDAANNALSRRERLQVLASSASQRAPTLAQALTRYCRIRLRPRGLSELIDNSSPREQTWTVSVQAIASLDVLIDFVKARLSSAPEILMGLMGVADFGDDNTAGNSRGNTTEIDIYQGSQLLPNDMSVLGAVYQPSDIETVLPRRLWSETFTLEYCRRDAAYIEEVISEDREDGEEEVTQAGNKGDQSEYNFAQLPGALALRQLAKANEWINAPWSIFVNAKLTAKLNRQLEDPLVVVASVLPQWIFDSVRGWPFLYPLESRRLFVEATSLGYARSLGRWQPQSEDGLRAGIGIAGIGGSASNELGRLSSRKYRIARERLLQGTLKLLEMSKSLPSQVEIEFFEEAGTGLGPTQEFFALASHEFASQKNMWRDQQDQGLFPRAETGKTEERMEFFIGLGRLVARAILDRRLLDLRLSSGFFTLVLDVYPTASALDLLEKVDRGLAFSLQHILETKDPESLALDFTLPGTSTELVSGGMEMDVTNENKYEYAQRVAEMTLYSPSVIDAVRCFSKGFGESVPVSALHAFLPEELATMFGGAGLNEDWSASTLKGAIRADHGYTMESRPVQELIEIMAQLTPHQRRAFLAFMTGSPNLPFGGFRSLQPPFTVVLKHPETEGGDRDLYLPSVMTCANYLKLPEYSSPEIMHERLLMAIQEGAGAFPLS